MLKLSEVEEILTEYSELFVPAMLEWEYPLTLVKGGPDYPHLPEQSHFAHIINGVFGLAQLVKFLVTQNVDTVGLTADNFRKALALYTVHEVHKDNSVELLGTSQFSIPLERLRDEYERLGLSTFADVDEHLMRSANVHKRSSKHGDLLLSQDPESARLWLFVRLADTFASVKTPSEAVGSLERYLAQLGPAFAAQSPPARYRLYYHALKDVRGVLTRVVHEAVARELQDVYGFFPILYFATGTLYMGPLDVDLKAYEAFMQSVIDRVLGALTRYSSGEAKSAAETGLRKRRYDFEDFVYSFASIGTLLDIAKDLAKGNKGRKVRDAIGSLLGKSDLPEGWDNEAIATRRLGLDLDQPEAFMDHWDRAYYYLLYADHVFGKLYPESPVEWFASRFFVPSDVVEYLNQIASSWNRGGFGKYMIPVAYHFLKGPAFKERSAEALPPEQVMEILHEHTLDAMDKLDTYAARQAVAADLGFRQDLQTYLNANLYLSLQPEVHLSEDALEAYSNRKRKGHSGQMCSICNRYSEYVQPLRTGVLDDFGRIFSNRVLPAFKAPGDMRPWCPICHLEFILRKLVGLGLPGGAGYGNSYRIFLYVLPTFSFTPEHLKLHRPLLKYFEQVTNLPVRDYGKDAPGAPRVWLEHRSFDTMWMEDLTDVLARQAERIAEMGGRNYVGERVSMSPIQAQPHYYLIVWEKAAYDQGSDDAQVATRTEAWTKALYAAAVTSTLTSCKVYVTERPYLPVADPAELKATVTLDSPPPALRGLLGGRTDMISLYGKEQGQRSGLETVLDLSAALWVVNADVRASDRQTKDKYVSSRLGTLNASPLAGATFYKEFSRLNEGKTPPSLLATACEVLLETQVEIQGGELMDLVEGIAKKSLEIALPFRGSGRGKARRYELVFREAVAAMRKAQRLIPEMREAAIGRQTPSKQSVAELKTLASGTLLKALERRQQSKRGEINVHAYGDELGRLVGELVDILVEDLYLGRARGSFARFLRLENSLADGIYYYTDRNLSQRWEAYKQERDAANS